VKISIIIRTYNEETYLDDVLRGVAEQRLSRDGLIEVVIVDSGSEDGTLEIAKKHKCKVVHISQDEFTFGASLNVGCASAGGDVCVFLSGHCIPEGDKWLDHLVRPIVEQGVSYVYGRQIGGAVSKFSECRIFAKYFPGQSVIPQHGFFCNNANAALKRDVWESNRFDETLTGLEDMELAKRLRLNGMSIAYVSEAAVCHIHDESWSKVRNRYEREAYALRRIMPEVHISLLDFFRYFLSAVGLDIRALSVQGFSVYALYEIVMYRFMQYWGGYVGNKEHRMLSKEMKEKYFYPK